MNVDILLVADYANIADGGKLNVMGIFRQIFSTQFPARHPEMYLIVGLSANPAEFDMNKKLTVKLLDPDAKEMMTFSREFVVPKGIGWRRSEVNNILHFRDIIFPKEGTYEFSILVDNDLKHSINVELTKRELKLKS